MPAQVPNTGLPALMWAAIGPNSPVECRELAPAVVDSPPGRIHAVDGFIEILGRAQHSFPRRTELVQHRRMSGECALYGQDAGHAVLGVLAPADSSLEIYSTATTMLSPLEP